MLGNIDIKLIIQPIIYIIIGIIAYKIIKGIILKASHHANKRISEQRKQRIQTINTLIINIVKYIIVIFVILAILSTLGINVTSILAGLGITTAIIGLAFQDMAKDLIAGFSILSEGNFEIGDTIEVDGFLGEVVFMGLKTTRIQHFNGSTYIVANRYMDKVKNYSLTNTLAIVDIAVAYEEDNERVTKVFNKIIEELKGKIPNATGDLRLLGVNELADSSVVYRLVVETEPAKHYETQRFLREELKKRLDKENVKIPYNQIEVHNGK
ncbi:MAG: mechanosensitive ion channel family protein [Bacilli bacterium]|nr:mechanosensitive ion channel family protein [Bacilli bacterium]MBQ6538687.1 mechanosensitive ion channel family protein [Bacilli bacterium]